MPRQPLDLAPFRGLRYAAPDVDRFIDGGFDLARLLAPPYDIPDAAQALELQRSDPHNAARVTLPFELSRRAPDGGAAASPRYRAAAELLRGWIAEGVLALDEDPALYVYEQVTAEGRVQRGLIGALGLPETGPEAGEPAVRPHEDVADPPVRDRFRLMSVARANLEPIFLLYRGAGGAASAFTERISARTRPVVSTRTRDGAEHRLWAITDPGHQREITEDLAGRSALIADGHHRYAAYQRLREQDGDPGWRHGLALLVDSDTHPPRLGAIHRVLPGLNTEAALAAARTVAEVEPVAETGAPALAEAKAPALLLVSARGEAHLVSGFDEATLRRCMPDHSPDWRHLSTAALHEVLMPLWAYPEEGVRMVHEDPAEAVRAARAARAEQGTAVIVPPLRVEQVYAVADRGELTPRKSTSFGPKPRTGLVMRTLPQGRGVPR